MTKKPSTDAKGKALIKDLKNNTLKQVYVLYGEEKYLIRFYKNQLINRIAGDKNSINLSVFNKDYVLSEVSDIFFSFPFMSDKRLIIFDNIDVCKSNNQELLTALSTIPDYCYVLFIEETLDGRTKNFKKLKELNADIYFGQQHTKDLEKWIKLQVFNVADMTIDDTAVDSLLSMVDNYMDILDTEVKKLISYCFEKKHISYEDVLSLSVPNIHNKIFEMISSTISGRLKDSFLMYRDMLLLKEAPTKILKMINKEYLLILHIKQGKNINMSIKDIASALGKNEYIISKKYWNFVDSLSEEFLIKKLESGCNLEEAVMLGEIEDKTAVELMIAEQV